MKKGIILASLMLALALSGCGSTINKPNSLNSIAFSDTTAPPAHHISDTNWDCDIYDCEITAACVLLNCYQYDLYPQYIDCDTATELLSQYCDCAYPTSWEAIVSSLQEGVPVILKMFHEPMFTLGEEVSETDYLNSHWVVAYGLKDELILISDPMNGYVSAEIEQCREVWQKCGSCAIKFIQ